MKKLIILFVWLQTSFTAQTQPVDPGIDQQILLDGRPTDLSLIDARDIIKGKKDTVRYSTTETADIFLQVLPLPKHRTKERMLYTDYFLVKYRSTDLARWGSQKTNSVWEFVTETHSSIGMLIFLSLTFIVGLFFGSEIKDWNKTFWKNQKALSLGTAVLCLIYILSNGTMFIDGPISQPILQIILSFTIAGLVGEIVFLLTAGMTKMLGKIKIKPKKKVLAS